MRLLLDTHIFLWAVLEPERLRSSVRATLQDPKTELLVSAASAWEIATKFRIGKLPGAKAVVADYTRIVSELYAESLPITPAHALKAGGWEVPHRDPFDRMIAAQATIEALPLVTTDPAMKLFGIELV